MEKHLIFMDRSPSTVLPNLASFSSHDEHRKQRLSCALDQPGGDLGVSLWDSVKTVITFLSYALRLVRNCKIYNLKKAIK